LGEVWIYGPKKRKNKNKRRKIAREKSKMNQISPTCTQGAVKATSLFLIISPRN